MTYFKTPYAKRGVPGTPYNGLTAVTSGGGDGGKRRSDAKGWQREFVLPSDLKQRIKRAENAKRAALLLAIIEADDDE